MRLASLEGVCTHGGRSYPIGPRMDCMCGVQMGVTWTVHDRTKSNCAPPPPMADIT